ncbi:MAG: TIGR04076 family protein [Candidatus Thorarchaeota archaeon]
MVNHNYDIEIEIFESDGFCTYHKVGEKFKYPEDRGKICQWLLDSMNSMIRVLKYGGTLPWTYSDTPYEKIINLKGVTTEFVRCPDPTARVVAKITRIPISNL